MIRLYGEVQESIHLFLPALPLSQTVVEETGVDPDTVDLHYQGGFRDPLIEQIAWAIRAEMTEPAPAGKMLVETLVAALAVHVVRQYSNLAPASISLPSARGALNPRSLRRVIDFIEAQLSEGLTIEALAKEAFLSPFHFARAFKGATGTTPHRYLTYRRIERAKALIAEGELPLAEVADECGFSSQAHFTRRFKQFVGTTPGEYRKVSGAMPSRAASRREDARDSKTIDLTPERHGDVVSMNVSGQIVTAATSGAFREAVRNATRKTDRAVILDMGEHSIISSWGARTILLIARELQSQDTKLVLCALSAQVLEWIRVTGFERFVSIHESKAQALASLPGTQALSPPSQGRLRRPALCRSTTNPTPAANMSATLTVSGSPPEGSVRTSMPLPGWSTKGQSFRSEPAINPTSTARVPSRHLEKGT